MTNDDTKMPEPMSKEEMIDTLKGLVFGTFDRTTAKEREALDMAIKALEKEIPKCVKVEKWINTYCPNGCGQVLSIHHGDGYYSIQHEPDRCPNCGQVLEWEDAE